jgi:hypothetical protein
MHIFTRCLPDVYFSYAELFEPAFHEEKPRFP